TLEAPARFRPLRGGRTLATEPVVELCYRVHSLPLLFVVDARIMQTGGPSLVGESVLREPGLGDALLRPRQPRLRDEVAQLFAFEAREVGDADEDGRVAVEVRRREEHAAFVGEEVILHSLV